MPQIDSPLTAGQYKVGDTVVVGDVDDPSDRYDGTIVDVIPAQEGYHPQLLIVADEMGALETVSVAAVYVEAT